MSPAVTLHPYDTGWPARFKEERRRLAAVFEGVACRIEHAGSTAVPGLSAKPVIDLLVGLEALEHAVERVDALAALGYTYVPEYEEQIPDRRYFRKSTGDVRSHHLHCVVEGGTVWGRTLRFRDRLRSDADLRESYTRLKAELADSHDKGGYTAAKTTFVDAVLAAKTSGSRDGSSASVEAARDGSAPAGSVEADGAPGVVTPRRDARRAWLWWSTGKDSAWALHVLRRDPGVVVERLVTTVTPTFGRVAIHGTRHSVLETQAASAGLPSGADRAAVSL